MRTTVSTALVAILAATANAIEPLPKESGWNGYVNPTISLMELRDNTVAGAGPLEVGNKRIDSLDERPESESAASASVSAEIGYMFADQGLYVYLGNRLEDILRLDNTSELGLRYDLGGIGILDGGLLFSSVPVQVWEDPFLVGADREETDRSSAGAFIGLSGIFGSFLDVQMSFRNVEIDNEASGASLPLNPAERALLARDGDSARIECIYTWIINPRHILVPSVNFGVYDADGAAMSRDGGGFQLTHAYRNGPWRLVSNIALRKTNFDEENPVFGMKQDEEEVILSITGFYGNFLDMENLSLTASILYAERDSDINFYYGETTIGSVGLLYTF